jgi:putative nucleotidyltransferase with HDIG domain
MTSEAASLEPKLKEILYRCLEQIRATKAALYLSTGESMYEVTTSYGFRQIEPRQYDAKDDLVDRMVVKRTPFYVNSLTEDPRLSQLLFSAGTTHMMIAPIYSRGRLIGFIDMRDKAARQPFGAQDLIDAQKIADEFLELFAQKNIFGQRAQPVAQQQRVGAEPPGETSNALAAIDEAKRAVGRGMLRPKRGPETLTEAQLETGAVMLPAFLSLPGVLFAALSSFGRFNGLQRIASRAEFRQDASTKFEARLRGWLQKRGEQEGLNSSSMVFPLGKGAVPIDANLLATILSAPMRVQSMRGIVLTVGFEGPPTSQTRKLLAGLLRSAEKIINQVISHEILGSTMIRVAEKLVEPDYQRYTVLMSHSRRVSELASKLAESLDLPPAEVEKARIAGLVHDVGMRMLDYHTLYRKGTLTGDEMRILREHPLVGAALIAESPLGLEIANIVLSHHERPDGTGYPNGLKGDEIPLLSRILHVCECFDAMTAVDSYQTAVPQPSAISRMRRVGGSQLDVDLVARFEEMMASTQIALRS